MCFSISGFCSVRHGLAFILLLCNFSSFTQQVNMSIAMPAMVSHTALPSQPNASTEKPPTDAPDSRNVTPKELQAVAPVYDWNPEIQGVILSSINYGSFLGPIPVGYVAGIVGAKYVVGAGLFISSVLTLFTPLAADAGATLLIVLRVVEGIAQVMVSTGQFSIWVKWAPPMERSQLITIAVSGGILGIFIILSVGGVLNQTIGWPYIFYIFGGIGCACTFLWFPLVYEDPVNHPFISTGEKEYIVSSLAEQSGILSALPFVFSFPFLILGGQLAGFLLSRKILRLVTIRKLFTSLGILIPTGLLLCLPWVRSSHSTSIALLVLTCVFGSFCEVGVLINIVDIAPRYCAFLQGLSQVFCYIGGAISPTVSGYLLNKDSEFGWRNVFLVSAAINIVGLVFYLIFGRAEVQNWAKE
ncbi:putative small intestine urate exporter [Galemys pyrenaicus]|uniref:Putative small intestine urate exporter n=1 Tax=Galemys pyrenaicus TaxID=202257 RepID=A0A8J5ZTP4_GALPY|nr:putative small intestine urate exporter [Galemys pyrenaicus]